jgi:precorrin-6B methylase 2
VAENILTHPDSTAIGIDVFTNKEVTDRFFHNLEISGLKNRITILKGKSQIMLRQIPVNSVDAIFIDGSHKTKDVLQDAVICWKILKVNGIMIFDDYYGWGVKAAVDAFINVFRDNIVRECLDDITKEVLTEKIFVIRKW